MAGCCLGVERRSLTVMRIGWRRNTDTDDYPESTDAGRVNPVGSADISQAIQCAIGHFRAAAI
jgi:hypothetical protein